MPDDMPYELTAPNAYTWTEKVYDAIIAGTMSADIDTKVDISTVTIGGPCPRCSHPVNFSRILDGVTGERVGVLGPDDAEADRATDDYLPITAGCCCNESHPGRPDGTTHGCGINFVVEVEAP
jgi:hypothetical protein